MNDNQTHLTVQKALAAGIPPFERLNIAHWPLPKKEGLGIDSNPEWLMAFGVKPKSENIEPDFV